MVPNPPAFSGFVFEVSTFFLTTPPPIPHSRCTAAWGARACACHLPRQLHPCDFGVRFCIDPDSGSAIFNTKKCKKCDPCYIGELYVRSVSRKLSI